jgi:hypothetical protein
VAIPLTDAHILQRPIQRTDVMTSQRRTQIRTLKQRRVDEFHDDHRSPRSRACRAP